MYKFLLYKNKLGDKINGFISFYNSMENPKKVIIFELANKKSGVGGKMIKKIQSMFDEIVLIPVDDHAENFYKHMGFKIVFKDSNGDEEMIWKKSVANKI